MYDLAVADIDTHMPLVEHQVAGERLIDGVHGIALLPLGQIIVVQVHPELLIDGPCETGAVRALGQTFAAPDIRQADVLYGEIRHRLAGIPGLGIGAVRTLSGLSAVRPWSPVDPVAVLVIVAARIAGDIISDPVAVIVIIARCGTAVRSAVVRVSF